MSTPGYQTHLPGSPGGVKLPTSSKGNSLNIIPVLAAQTVGIPEEIEVGVWGAESNFGRFVKTSSAGAMGWFQFIPGTAKTYGYPMTNSPNPLEQWEQSVCAARYLKDLYGQHGNDWEAALQAYSGGGYGLAHVQDEYKQFTSGKAGFGDPKGNAPDITIGPGGSVEQFTGTGISAVTSVLDAIKWVLQPSHLLRVGEVVLGGILVVVIISEAVRANSGKGVPERILVNTDNTDAKDDEIARLKEQIKGKGK